MADSTTDFLYPFFNIALIKLVGQAFSLSLFFSAPGCKADRLEACPPVVTSAAPASGISLFRNRSLKTQPRIRGSAARVPTVGSPFRWNPEMPRRARTASQRPEDR